MCILGILPSTVVETHGSPVYIEILRDSVRLCWMLWEAISADEFHQHEGTREAWGGI